METISSLNELFKYLSPLQVVKIINKPHAFNVEHVEDNMYSFEILDERTETKIHHIITIRYGEDGDIVVDEEEVIILS